MKTNIISKRFIQIVYLVIFAFFNINNSLAQVYTCLPSVNTYTNTIENAVSGSNCNYTFNGSGILQFKVSYLNQNQIVFAVKKADGSAFKSGTTMYVKESTSPDFKDIVCGTPFPSDGQDVGGRTSASTIKYEATFVGTHYFCAVTISSTGLRYYSDKIAITGKLDDPSLIITSPNGGESYTFGQKMDIAWSSNNYSGDVVLELIGASSTTKVELITSRTADTGNFSWIIPSTLSPGNYRIKIFTFSPYGATSDVSDNSFKIGEATQAGSLTVNIEPKEASIAGAQFSVDGGSWNCGGTTIENLIIGNHSISFSSVSGWISPIEQLVYVSANNTISVSATYTKTTEINLLVPFKSQCPPGDWDNTKNCGPTCILSVAKYYSNGIPTDQDIKDIDDWLYKTYKLPINNYNGSSTNTSHLVSISQNFFKISAASFSNWTVDQLVEELKNGYPVIVAVRVGMSSSTSDRGHFMILRGVSENRNMLIFNDVGKGIPEKGLNAKYSKDAFLSSWKTQSNSGITMHGLFSGSGGIGNKPENLVADFDLEKQTIALCWEKVKDSTDVDNYNIYRNGNLISTVSGEKDVYVDNSAEPGVMYEYFVTCMIGNQESARSNTAAYSINNFTSILNRTSGTDLNIYPNPAMEKIYIDSKNKEYILQIINNLGQLVFQKENFTDGEINTSGLPRGIYIVRFITETNSLTRKLVLK
jgi:hypothetical protein